MPLAPEADHVVIACAPTASECRPDDEQQVMAIRVWFMQSCHCIHRGRVGFLCQSIAGVTRMRSPERIKNPLESSPSKAPPLGQDVRGVVAP